jgi:hypothetical protein
MLSDDRPTATQLMGEPYLATVRQIMDEQTPHNNCDTLALLTCIRFQNKNKALIAFLRLLQKESKQIPSLLQLNEFIHVLELLVICMS